MKDAGKYNWRLLKLHCVRTADSTTNDQPRTYTQAGWLWGSVDIESANTQSEEGEQRSIETGTIRLRGNVNITTQDRIYWKKYNLTFKIDGLYQDFANYETVLDVHSYLDGATYTEPKFFIASGGACIAGHAIGAM